MIKGIFTPNVVPLHDDGSVNEGELRRYVDWLISKGIHGLYPNGSTGEFIRFSYEQRLRIVEIICSESRGRVPVLAGAAEANIPVTLEACRRYADLGCRAVSLTGPYYFKVSQESIEEYFRVIASQSPIDILLYNIPQFANEISLPVVKRLASDCPRIIGIKDSSRDFPRLMATLREIKAVRPDFVCFTGTEETLLPALLMGVDGGTIATSGVAPEAVLKLYDAFLAGNLDEAKRIQFKLLELIETMFAAGNFPDGFRKGVDLRGFRVGGGLHPLGSQQALQAVELGGKIACLLSDCGYSEAAASCTKVRADIEGMLANLRRRLP